MEYLRFLQLKAKLQKLHKINYSTNSSLYHFSKWEIFLTKQIKDPKRQQI